MERDYFLELISDIFPRNLVVDLLLLWSPNEASAVLPTLRSILAKGALANYHSDESAALLRIQRASAELYLSGEEETTFGAEEEGDGSLSTDRGIWFSVCRGNVALEK